MVGGIGVDNEDGCGRLGIAFLSRNGGDSDFFASKHAFSVESNVYIPLIKINHVNKMHLHHYQTPTKWTSTITTVFVF